MANVAALAAEYTSITGAWVLDLARLVGALLRAFFFIGERGLTEHVWFARMFRRPLHDSYAWEGR